ncbi:uncharacterized protein BKA55DRAFT_546379 [Fusarium redolens]|uniref:Uncharacterized protein n=1 Tax=Fusarium redolens TaxID=48865 RepID=A0A9P9FYI1_FUSRE|nr:uncharacterized protein BKA55DRAFT_546379 [Fusarium redolens]KAH7216946.1 hypothetical protein BKA55DRAFT_546379 [Fusarium redolens]
MSLLFDDNTVQYAAYEEVNERPHEANWSNQLIGDSAAYGAAQAYEEHCEKVGEPDDKEFANELIFGFISAGVYREIETRGLDFIDAESAKEIGRKAAQTALAEKNGWDINN